MDVAYNCCLYFSLNGFKSMIFILITFIIIYYTVKFTFVTVTEYRYKMHIVSESQEATNY